MYLQLQKQKELIIENMKRTQSIIHSYIRTKKEQMLRLKESTVNGCPIEDIERLFKENKPSLLRVYNQEVECNSKELDVNELNSIIKHYQDITGLLITQEEKNLFKIEFNFKSNEHSKKRYIVISYLNHLYEIKEIFPSSIDYEPYLVELNLTEDRAMFLSRLILNEYINKNQ